VDADGMVRVTGADLARAGLPLAQVDPRTLRLFAGGHEVALAISGEADGRFDPADAVVFYGQASRTKYAPINVYALSYGHGPGRRMAEREGSPGTGQAVTFFTDTLRVEPNLRYVSDKPTGPGAKRTRPASTGGIGNRSLPRVTSPAPSICPV
jgi:hypothetical protein